MVLIFTVYFSSLNDDIVEIEKSFRDGCSVIAAKITACGVSTAANASPTVMSNNIQTIYNNRYNTGYNNGRVQGQNDVRNNPNGYGFYTGAQYNQNYTNGYNAGYAVIKGMSAERLYTTGGNNLSYSFTDASVIMVIRDAKSADISVSCTNANFIYGSQPQNASNAGGTYVVMFLAHGRSLYHTVSAWSSSSIGWQVWRIFIG